MFCNLNEKVTLLKRFLSVIKFCFLPSSPHVIVVFLLLGIRPRLLLSGSRGGLLMRCGGGRRPEASGCGGTWGCTVRPRGPGVTGSVQTGPPAPSLGVCPSHPAVRLQLFYHQGSFFKSSDYWMEFGGDVWLYCSPLVWHVLSFKSGF